MRPLIGILAVLAWGVAVAAQACSVTEDFVRSSTYEMVEQADAVAVVTAIDQLPPEGEDEHISRVRFRIDFALKGAPPAEFVSDWAHIGEPFRSDPADISSANPEGFMGPCVRMTFAKGGQYVVFLELSDDPERPGWQMARHIFWRDAEDYDGPDSLWVEVLKFYVDLQAAHPDRMEALEALAAHLPRLESPGAGPRERALAADVRDHLSSLSPWKPTAYLIEAYEALERGAVPRFGVRGLDANREGGEAEALTDAFFGIERPAFDTEAQKAYVLQSLVNGDHPDAGPFFERILAGDPSPFQTGTAIRWFAANGQALRAFDLSQHATNRLEGLSSSEAADLIGDVVMAMHGEYDYRSGGWTVRPEVADHWPALAQSLHATARNMGILDRVPEALLAEAISSRFAGDWRAEPGTSIVLAGNLNEDAEAWAIAELAKALPTADPGDDADPVWLPARMLAVGYGDERNAALIQGYCSGPAGRVVIMAAMAELAEPILDFWLLGSMVVQAPDRAGFDVVRDRLLARASGSGDAAPTSIFASNDDEAIQQVLEWIASPPPMEPGEEALCS